MTIAWTEFYEQLEKTDVGNLYLFTGPEAYVKKQALVRLRAALLPDGLEAMNETVIEGAGAQAIIEACETLPFLSERRLVIVRDWAPLMPGKSKNEADEAERMSAWIKNVPETCCLVFEMRDQFDGRKKMSAALAKAGRVVAFEHLSDDKLLTWLGRQAARAGATIEPAAAEHLTFLAGRSLTRLVGEMEKLTAYAGPGGVVTRAMVDELVPPSLESTVFQMIDCLMDRKLSRVMELIKALVQSGETRIGILAVLTRQMRMLTHIKLLKADGLKLSAIEKRLSLNHYAAMRMDRQASRYSAEQLEAAYRACVEADYAIKRGRAHDDDALNKLLLELGAL